MKKYLKNFYDAGTIAFHYTILYPLYSGLGLKNTIYDLQNVENHQQGEVELLDIPLVKKVTPSK